VEPLEVNTLIVADAGGAVPVPVGDVVVVVLVDEDDLVVELDPTVVVGAGLPEVLVGYVKPELPQDPAEGALIGTRVPSTRDPCRL